LVAYRSNQHNSIPEMQESELTIGSILELADPNEAQQPGGKIFLNKLGAWVQSFLTKFWIWVVAIMLFVIGLGSGQVVLYRIVYMALFLIFVLTFQVHAQANFVPIFHSSTFVTALLQNLENHDVWLLVDGDCLLYAGARDDLHLPI
jgi:hypothetical protein